MSNCEDYTQILIPVNKSTPKMERGGRRVVSKQRSDEGHGQGDEDAPSIKWLTLMSLFLTGVVAVMATVAVIRYEGKVGDYENRITELETDLDTFFQVLAEELDYDRDAHPGGRRLAPGDQGHSQGHGQGHKKVDDIVRDEGWKALVEDLEDKIVPRGQDDGVEGNGHKKVDKEDGDGVIIRNKRQILPEGAIPRFPNLPNSFGPEVERTSDGVPIVDQSYRIHGGVSPGRRFQPIIQPPADPTPDSEGLRIYEGLVATGGINEPKSPDFYPGSPIQNPLLPHHKVSAAWSEKGAASSGVQTRAGDGTGFGGEWGQRSTINTANYRTMDRYGGPRFGDEMAYTRSYRGDDSRLRSLDGRGGSGSGRNNWRQPAPTPAPSSSLVRPGVGGVGVGATYHRNSRVAATYSSGIDNYRGGGAGQARGGGGAAGAGAQRRRRVQGQGQQGETRFDEYPPLRRMGYGQGEVIARVVQDDDDHHLQRQGQIQGQGRRGGESRKPGSLATGRNLRDREQQYLSRRPVETRRRPLTPVTENPAGYSERNGPLNVTIGRSIPFGTYYSSDRGNWEINTQPPTQPPRYRNRY